MRALVVSDIHGNLQALEAVLEVARGCVGGGFDELWNLGDMVGYGARPNEVIETLRGLEATRAIHVRGNHDRVCCGLSSSQGFNPIAADGGGMDAATAAARQPRVAARVADGADSRHRTCPVCAWFAVA